MSGYATTSSMQSALANLIGSAPPLAEAGSAAPGTATKVSRMDHQHPRLASVNYWTTDGSGLVTVTFTQAFDVKPGLVAFPTDDATASAVPRFKAKSWVQDAGGKFVGAVIYGERSRSLPAVIALLGALAGYATYEPAAGATFSLVAIKQS